VFTDFCSEPIKQVVYFVMRLKDNACYGAVEDFAVPHRRGVRHDQVIFFDQLAQVGIDAYFRRIEFYDGEYDRVLVFLTSHVELAAATIAAVSMLSKSTNRKLNLHKRDLKYFLQCCYSLWDARWPVGIYTPGS
jgi:hypothetical protein